MPLTIKNPEVDRLARDLATLTGETLTLAVRTALAERLERLKRTDRPWGDAAIQAIVDHCAALPLLDTRSTDEILGYDENGLPG